MFKKLNEQLERFLEGDVVSFADFKRKKRGAEAAKEIEKELTDEMSKMLFIEIGKVKVEWAETTSDVKPMLNDGDEHDFEAFQKLAYEYDYQLKKVNGLVKIKYIANIKLTGAMEEETVYEGYIFPGGDGDQVNIIKQMHDLIQDKTGVDVVIKNDPIDKLDLDFGKLDAQQPKQEPAQENDPIIKDYTNGGTKKAMDVEVGDILYSSWGYDQTNVDFYRVIKRTKASIKLEELQYRSIESGDMSGSVVPIDHAIASSDVDGKTFRISNYGPICKISDSQRAYLWDGKPKYVSYYG